MEKTFSEGLIIDGNYGFQEESFRIVVLIIKLTGSREIV